MSHQGSVAKKQDGDLWLAYAQKLKELLAPEGLGKKGAIYIPPISTVGITGGPPRIAQVVQNLGVYNVADKMLDPDTPVFIPGGTSYYQQLSLFSSFIQLNTSSGSTAAERLEDSQKALSKAQDEYATVNKAARAEYKKAKADEEVPTSWSFDQWIGAGNYPKWRTAWNNQDAASQAVDNNLQQTSGENWKQIQALKRGLDNAVSTSLQPGYNMPAADASALDVTGGQLPTNGQYFVPAYNIQSSYTRAVDDWKAKWNDPSFTANAKVFKFSTKDAEGKSWSQLGFDETKVDVSGSYCIFFKATFSYNNKEITEHISASEAGSELEVTIKARGYDVFSIDAGRWDVPDVSAYKLKSTAPPNLRKGLVKVEKVLMGYGISMDISMSSSMSSRVRDLTEKAKSTGGSASFFGYNVGLGASGESKTTSSVNFEDVESASSGTVISIPPQDNNYPTLLAVIGRKQDTTINA